MIGQPTGWPALALVVCTTLWGCGATQSGAGDASGNEEAAAGDSASDTGGSDDAATEPDDSDEGDAESSVRSTPLGISTSTPWPTIHHDQLTSNTSPFCAPTAHDSSGIASTFTDNPSGELAIVNLQGKTQLYIQGSPSGTIYAYAYQEDGSLTLTNSFYVGSTYPYAGGGVIDSKDNLWWTNKNQLIRVGPTLSDPIYSETLADGVWNGTTFLSDGAMLVTGQSAYAVIKTSKSNGVFPVVTTGDLLETAGLPPLSEDAALGPRPLTADNTKFFFVNVDGVYSLTYEPETQRLIKADDDWYYPAPEGVTFGVSHAVMVNGYVCLNNDPMGETELAVYCVDSASGELEAKLDPFPGAIVNTTWHTLGTVSDRDILVVIGNASTEDAGIAAYDMKTLSRIWHVGLPNISEAIVMSSMAGRVYVSSKESAKKSSPLTIHGIDYITGDDHVLVSDEQTGLPNKSLGFVGVDGRVFIPYGSGFYALRDADPTCD